MGLPGRWYFLQFEALRVNGEGGMLSSGSGGGSGSALFISSDGSPSQEAEVWKSLLPPGASVDSLREVSILGDEEMGLRDAGKFSSLEGAMFVKEATRAGFWLLSDVLLNQGWLFLTTFTSDVCLPLKGEENYRCSCDKMVYTSS